jgi:hypothetical protein
LVKPARRTTAMHEKRDKNTLIKMELIKAEPPKALLFSGLYRL